MDLKILWSNLAELKLKTIFDYYKYKAGEKTAIKISLQIVNSVTHLTSQPESGAIEELLNNREHNFRYIISGNYKTIYYINQYKNYIVIANVFDSRQNPRKIEETK